MLMVFALLRKEKPNGFGKSFFAKLRTIGYEILLCCFVKKAVKNFYFANIRFSYR